MKRHWEEGFEWCFCTLVKFILQFICGLWKQQNFSLFLARCLVAFQGDHDQQFCVFLASEFSTFPGNGWPWTNPSFRWWVGSYEGWVSITWEFYSLYNHWQLFFFCEICALVMDIRQRTVIPKSKIRILFQHLRQYRNRNWEQFS